METEGRSQFNEMKSELNNYVGVRDVDVWNRRRELFKSQFSSKAINLLDGSGIIVKWLKHENV